MDEHANITSSQTSSHHSSRSGVSPSASSKPPRVKSPPKLGDFNRLYASTAGFNPPHHFLSHLWPSGGDVKLGNLSKIVEQLRIADEQFHPSSRSGYTSDEARPDPLEVVRFPARATEPGFTDPNFARLDLSSSDRPVAEAVETEDNVSMPASSPPTLPSEQSPPSRYLESQGTSSTAEISRDKGHPKPVPQSQMLREILSYQLVRNGLTFPVYGKRRTVEDTHKSLALNLINHYVMDSFLARQYCSNAHNELHVFLDMSNINISFHKALRTKYSLADGARFTPLPRLNLQFLSQVLVRGRHARCLSAGCSAAPGRTEPKYVQELRELGYRVDLRERKRVDDGSFSVPKRNLLTRDIPVATSRYAEDLVDETLQTRIAEAVMEYFQEPGTIVLATGDAKPAQYSDGFFIYIDRALRMGWNVELVSWHASLSNAWTNTAWSSQWRDRFRIIELDDLLDDLLASYL